VYCKLYAPGRATWIIAKAPRAKAINPEPPSSIVQEFSKIDDAMLTFRRWVENRPKPTPSKAFPHPEFFEGVQFEPKPKRRVI
jgi:hypothetical protein